MMNPADAARAAAALLGGPLRDIEVLVDASERLVLRGQVGDRSVIVKAFADARHLRSAGLVTWLDRRLPPAGPAVVAPPIAVDHDLGIVVAPDLGPTSLHQVPGGPSTEQLRNAGAALAEVHRLVPEPDTGLVATTAPDHVAQLIDPGRTPLAACVPHRAPLIAAALDRIESGDRAWRRHGHPAVIHRDFHLRQLVPVGDRMGIVDWDLAAIGDPAFDLAYLLTYLETHRPDPSGPIHDGPDPHSPDAAAFLDGYGRGEQGAALLAEPDLAERLHSYRIFNLLRRASRRQRLGDAGWVAERDRMLDLMEEALGEGSVTR